MDHCTATVEAWSSAVLPLTDLSTLPAKVGKRLWVTPSEFLRVSNAVVLAEWAVTFHPFAKPALPAPPRRGPKQVYRDSSILVTALVHIGWQFAYEELIDYFRQHADAAQAAGFPPGQVISVGQYWERRRALGVLPFWLFFVALVWQLLRLAVIQGTDVILDATTQRTWFHDDPDAAWSFRKPGKGAVWGYKVHTLLCRWSQLPIMFLVTPANRHDSLAAIPLLLLAVTCLGLNIAIVRADAAYFTYPILRFVHSLLGASAVIDYNLRRQGKRKLATPFFLNQWRFHQLPRRIIERHFAWAKRYFGLEGARWAGLVAAFQHAALVYSVMLAVALVAHRYQRPELAGSRYRVLALKAVP
jgi:Transposase DDE domain